MYARVDVRVRAHGGRRVSAVDVASHPPSRWRTGALVMVALVSVVAAWLWREGGRMEPPGSATLGSGVHAGEAIQTPSSANAFLLPDDTLLGFVEVPAGPFLMGSDAALDSMAFEIERWSATQAIGTVDLPAYLIGRFEVTVAQYRAFLRASGHPPEGQATARPAEHPVAAVSWPDALAYARWLDAELRSWSETPEPIARRLGSGWRVTLPTEAQWEKAARSSDGRRYPWGDQPRPDRANYGTSAPAPVGSFACLECPYGLRDMSGNVWEWTRSPYQPYPYDESDDGLTVAEDALWVMRGGSFTDGAQNVRAAVRGGADPGARRPFIGFRLVISPD